jgi:hypothetical protein
MEKKNDIIVWLNHMANVLIRTVLISILLAIIIPIIAMFFVEPNWMVYATRVDKILSFIRNISSMIVVFLFIFKASKYIKSKFIFENVNKVAISSLLFFIWINLLFIIWMSVFATMSWKSKIWFIQLFLETSWFNNIFVIIMTLGFSWLYYILSVKTLKN